jgi:eukaryotic-like serine/threonine-protein kinase
MRDSEPRVADPHPAEAGPGHDSDEPTCDEQKISNVKRGDKIREGFHAHQHSPAQLLPHTALQYNKSSALLMAISSGMILGPYRIDRKLGAGGMGEVYAATHLMLGREVALKTLPRSEIRTEPAVARLIREARAAAALNHPNIVAVYDVADQDGILYIAMERVDGSTLRDVMAQRAIRPAEAVRLAIQIARGLAAAHAAGVLHRDVKPGNIMITRRNQVKVVDFGLAKAFEPPAGDLDATTTLSTESPLTEHGFVSGTIAYMSPEQAQGFAVDARSDIFSFGIVLYQMLAHVHPFEALSKAAIMANILRSEPRPLSEISPGVPAGLEEVVEFCLRKDLEDRAHSMHDVARMLEMAEEAMDRPASAGATKRRWPLFAAAGLTFALVAGWAAGHFLPLHLKSPNAPAATLRRLTWDDGLSERPALSADGRFLAFASDRGDGNNLDIYVRLLNGREPLRLTTDPAGDTDPNFSPDGSLVAFHSERRGGGVYVVPSFGGQERLVALRGDSPRFSPDGKWIVYWVGEEASNTGRIYIVPATGGAPTQLQPAFAEAQYPIWTPDGDHILFQGVDVAKSDTEPKEDWWVTSLDGRAAVRTGAFAAIQRAGLGLIYEPAGWRNGKVVFSARDSSRRSVFEIPISTRTWQVQGPPEALTFGTGTDGTPYPSPTAIAFTSYQNEINIWSRRLDENGLLTDKEARKLTTGDSYHTSASMDSRGSRLVFLIGRLPSRNVWIRDIATGREAAVAADSADKCAAVISPDGARVAWSACGPGKEAIYMAAVNPDLSVSVPEKVCDDCGRVTDWSRNGESLVFVDHSSLARAGILTLASGARTMIASAKYSIDTPRLSPDGGWLALSAVNAREGRAQIFAVPLHSGTPAPESEWVPITDAGSWDDKPVWTLRGDALLFYSRRDGFGCIWRQAVNQNSKRPEGAPKEIVPFHSIRLSMKDLSSYLASLTLGGDQILFNALESSGSIWVREDAPRAR